MFDYMLAGLPVIAPDFAPEIAFILRESGAGVLLDTGDVDALSSAMQKLIEDPAAAAEIGRRGQQAVYDRYNWEADADKLVAAYEREFERRGEGRG